MLAVAERTTIPLLHPLTTQLIIVIFLVFMLLGREDLLGRGLRLAGSERILCDHDGDPEGPLAFKGESLPANAAYG